MQGGFFSYGLLAALAIALIFAAVTDLQRRQIDNWLNAGIALAAPLFWLASGQGIVDVGFHIVIALVIFTLLAVLFAFGAMGGGDVKRQGLIAVPYGIAISFAGIWVIFSEYFSTASSTILSG
jgi:prepilin peptidase CpaA